MLAFEFCSILQRLNFVQCVPQAKAIPLLDELQLLMSAGMLTYSEAKTLVLHHTL
jgi:hypothetical protein